MTVLIDDVNSAIISGKFTNEQLDSISQAIRYARSQLQKKNCRSFRVNDSVKFYHNRQDRTYTGRVERVKVKNILVVTTCGLRFNVPANMLESA